MVPKKDRFSFGTADGAGFSGNIGAGGGSVLACGAGNRTGVGDTLDFGSLHFPTESFDFGGPGRWPRRWSRGWRWMERRSRPAMDGAAERACVTVRAEPVEWESVA